MFTSSQVFGTKDDFQFFFRRFFSLSKLSKCTKQLWKGTQEIAL